MCKVIGCLGGSVCPKLGIKKQDEIIKEAIEDDVKYFSMTIPSVLRGQACDLRFSKTATIPFFNVCRDLPQCLVIVDPEFGGVMTPADRRAAYSHNV